MNLFANLDKLCQRTMPVRMIVEWGMLSHTFGHAFAHFWYLCAQRKANFTLHNVKNLDKQNRNAHIPQSS